MNLIRGFNYAFMWGDFMRIFVMVLLLPWVGVAHANADLTTAIENVRATCGGIGAELSDMKKMAGITTAVTGVGTVAGGVALGTGIAKANVDKQADKLRERQQQAKEILRSNGVRVADSETEIYAMLAEVFAAVPDSPTAKSYKVMLDNKIAELDKKSKTLGNIRTGTMAAATATNIAGAIMSGTNRVKGDLKSQIDECLVSVKTLSNVRMQARISKTATDVDLARAENIIRACDAWTTVDISPINRRADGATISSGVGAGVGLAGTIVSGVANSDKVRNLNNKKEKNLNTAANVLAGGTAVASGVATVFNATQISAIKRAANIADECEEALK